jgi:hypothetical protein
VLQVALYVPVPARQEVHDRLDVAPVLVAVDVADAGRLTPLDVVVEARHPRPPAGLGALAGPVLEKLPQQLEGLAHPPGTRERPEVRPPGPVALPREVHPRELLVQAHPYVRVRLVVPEPDVEPRPVTLDELLLCEQRLRLGLRDQEVDPRDLGAEDPQRVRSAGAEVGRHALADRPRLADVDHLAVPVGEQVHAGLVGQPAPLLVECRRRFSHREKG